MKIKNTCSNMDVELSSLCRLCARKSKDMQDIFQNNSSDPTGFSGMLPLKIETVTSIKVLPEDGLPTQMCSECMMHLNSALLFKEKCLTADSVLRHYLNTAQEAIRRKQEEEIEAEHRNLDEVNSIQTDENEEDRSDVVDAQVVNNNEDGFACELCGKRYLMLAALRKHLSSKHDMAVAAESVHSSRRMCLCNVCGKQVVSVQLRQHIRGHEQNFQHLCTYCGKKYPTKFRLTQHVRVHTGEKPFVCSVCGKRFHEKSLLRSHQRRYLKLRPLQCTVCDKRFTNRSHLNTHLMIHTGEKPFACTECGSEFRSSNHLKRHWKLHSGEKSFTCSVCSKAFIQKSNYVQHLAVHREDKPFKCSECGKGFSYKCSLKMHVDVHRRKQLTTTIQ